MNGHASSTAQHAAFTLATMTDINSVPPPRTSTDLGPSVGLIAAVPLLLPGPACACACTCAPAALSFSALSFSAFSFII